MKVEELYIPGTVEIREDGEKRTIVGYGSVFHREGDKSTEYELMPGVIERVAKGAFAKVVKSRKDVVAAFNHSEDAVLGRRSNGTLRLFEDERGLRYEIDPPDTQAGRDMLALVARGDVTGSSIAFRVAPRGEKITRSDGLTVRTITQVGELRDIGPVTHPAFEGTTAQVRNVDAKRLAAEVRALMAREVAVRLRLIWLDRQNIGG